MADPRDRVGIVLPRGIRPPEDPTITVHDRHELMIDELRAELRGAVGRLTRAVSNAEDALRIHQETLVALVPVVNDLERGTLPGRIRRLLAWLALQRALVRGWVGVGRAPAPRPDLDNPEAMPKP